MSNMDHAVRYLHAVEKKNKKYFKKNCLKITDCVSLMASGKTVIVNITNASLPKAIKDDINDMFWI
jgi:hypothetical protein